MRVALIVVYALLALGGLHHVRAQDADEFDGVEAPVITPPDETVMRPEDIPNSAVDDDFLLEAGSLTLAILYAANYFIGRSQNKKVADKWLEASEPVLTKEFAYTGASAEPRVGLLEESKSNYKYYCTGRRFCSRFVADLQLAARHDLFSRLWHLVLPANDYLTIDVGLNDDALDPLVFGVTKKIHYNSLTKAFPELITMAKRQDTTQVPEAFCFAADNIETPKSALTPSLVKQIKALEPFLDYFVISDVNVKPAVGLPTSELRVLSLRFKMRDGSKELDPVAALSLATYLIDATGTTMKLSRDIKASANKKRTKFLADRAAASEAVSEQARIQNDLKEKKRQEYDSMSYEEKQKYDAIQKSREMRKRATRKK